MTFTVLSLLFFAELYLFPNGKIAIINLDRNPAYVNHRAKCKGKDDNLQEEFGYLASQHLKWECEPGDFHEDNQIVFTAACSQKLIHLGLHINKQYIKECVTAYMQWTFFTRAYLAGDNLLSMLPPELLDYILVKTNPSYERIYNPIGYPGFFKAVELGKERGYKERLQASLAQHGL